VTRGSTGLRQNALGPFQIAFFVISAAGPLVAMAGGIPVAMLLGNGPGTPALFLLTSLILLGFSLGYTDMARDIRQTGAFYAFAARGFGAIAASATGLLALVSYNLLQIGLYGLFGVAAAALAAGFGLGHLPWWGPALAALGLVAALGYRQVDLSARVLGVLVALEYGVVLVLCLCILGQGGAAGLSARPFAPAVVGGGAPAIGLMFCFASFVGFEATTIYSEEARDPARTIPFATYLSVVLIGAFYTFCTWSIVEGAGVDRLWPLLHALPDPTELLFRLSDRFAPAALSLAMRLLFVTSTFASILAFHNAIARYAFAMGREGLLPARLGDTHHRHASPHMGSALQSLIALVAVALFALAGADPVLTVFTIPSSLGVLGIILLMAITAAAILRYLLARHRSRIKPFITGLSCVALVAVAVLATLRFSLLTGRPDPYLALLPAVLPLALLLGALLALRLRRADPHMFHRIGKAAPPDEPPAHNRANRPAMAP
jgi:amino acid transporter